jgi:hypothetical protein
VASCSSRTQGKFSEPLPLACRRDGPPVMSVTRMLPAGGSVKVKLTLSEYAPKELLERACEARPR